MSENSDQGQITLLLHRFKKGDRDAEAELMDIVYDQLKRMARKQLQRENTGQTLQPSDLVNQLYIRLLHDASIDWQDRSHLFALAARNMRRILVDHARKCSAERRPPPELRVSLDDTFVYTEERSTEFLALDEALERLAAWDERQARVVEMRIFSGLNVQEAATALGISERTVKADWAMARAWLSEELNGRGRTSDAAGAG